MIHRVLLFEFKLAFDRESLNQFGERLIGAMRIANMKDVINMKRKSSIIKKTGEEERGEHIYFV